MPAAAIALHQPASARVVAGRWRTGRSAVCIARHACSSVLYAWRRTQQLLLLLPLLMYHLACCMPPPSPTHTHTRPHAYPTHMGVHACRWQPCLTCSAEACPPHPKTAAQAQRRVQPMGMHTPTASSTTLVTGMATSSTSRHPARVCGSATVRRSRRHLQQTRRQQRAAQVSPRLAAVCRWGG